MAFACRFQRLQLGLLVLLGACQPGQDDGDEQPAAAAATAAADEPAPARELTCSGPITASDTAVSLQRRFPDQARWETLPGPEGVEFPGLVLWPDDPARRIEVMFADEGQRTVSSIEVGRGSRWRAVGLAVGDPVARVNEANGKPFKLWGFSWDYGGYVSDLGGGRLAALPGGCRVIVRLGPREGAEVPDALVGDRELPSDDPRLEAAGVTIEELTLSF
jgi:hypothetical protein